MDEPRSDYLKRRAAEKAAQEAAAFIAHHEAAALANRQFEETRQANYKNAMGVATYDPNMSNFNKLRAGSANPNILTGSMGLTTDVSTRFAQAKRKNVLG